MLAAQSIPTSKFLRTCIENETHYKKIYKILSREILQSNGGRCSRLRVSVNTFHCWLSVVLHSHDNLHGREDKNSSRDGSKSYFVAFRSEIHRRCERSRDAIDAMLDGNRTNPISLDWIIVSCIISYDRLTSCRYERERDRARTHKNNNRQHFYFQFGIFLIKHTLLPRDR